MGKNVRIIFTCALSALILTFFSVTVHSSTTENLFLVSIDGIRDLEAFDYPFQPEQTEHPYIPFIWNALKPLGTAYMEMYNIGCTFTSPGHATMLTGEWQIGPNYGLVEDAYQTRAWTPTVFEYARKELGLPKSKTWCVVGKTNCRENDWSIHPNYGEAWGANLIQYPERGHFEADSSTVDKLMEVLDADHPSLVFVNLRDVDQAGHSADWDLYIGAILKADRAVQRIWERINSDPFYAGNTTLIVTTDHGRHSPGYGDFQNHGGMCKGCKHVMCLFVGPETPEDVEITRRSYQIDIAPTIGAFLGFSTPYARGQVLGEAIAGYDLPDRYLMKDPATAVYDGMVFLTWSDNRTGTEEVYFSVSFNGGTTWEDPCQISNSGVYATLPDIDADKTGVHLVWVDYRSDIWEVFYRKSEDFGTTWEAERLMFSSIMEDENGLGHVTLWEPFIGAERGSNLLTASAHPLTIGSKVSHDGGETWQLEFIDRNCYFPLNVNAARLSRKLCITWCDQAWSYDGNHNWEVFYKRSGWWGFDWLTWRRLSFNLSYSINPSIDSDRNKRVAVAWADNESGSFQIFYTRSENSGWWWGGTDVLSSSPVGAWEPDLVWDRNANTRRLIWVDYRDGNGELYHRIDDGSGWSAETRLTYTDGSVFKPCFAIDDTGDSFLVWETVTPAEVQLGMCNCFP
jgi:hypothetical protein